MKPHSTRALALSALLTISACASAPPPGEAERSGDLYTRQGSHHLALPQYEDASREDPENERVRASLKQAQAALFEQRRESARTSLDRGAPAAALETYARAVHELGAQYPEMDLFGKEVAQRSEVFVRAAVKAERFEQAYDVQSAMVTTLPDELSSNAKQELGRVRQAWLKQLERRAISDEEQRLWGSALLFWSKAASLEARPKYATHRQELREKITTRSAFTVRMPQDTLDPAASAIVAHLQEVDWAPGFRLDLLGAGPTPRAGVVLSVSYEEPRCQPLGTSGKRCATIFELVLTPLDTRLAPRTVREQFSEDGPELGVVQSIFYLQGARATQRALEQEFALHQRALMQAAEEIPLERGRMDAEVKALVLFPDVATPERVRRIEEVSGLTHVLALLRE